MAGQYGNNKKTGLQLLQQVQKYIGSHDLSTSGFTGSWALNQDKFIDVGPEVGKMLGIPAKNIQNGSYSLSLNDLAGLALMNDDANSDLTPDQRKGFDNLMATIGNYGNAKDAYKYYNANPNAANLRALLNNAMTGSTGLVQQAYTAPPASAYPVAKWAQEYAGGNGNVGGYGPGGNWTYNQMRQYDAVSNFLSYWPQLDSPQTQRELTKAVSLGMTANQIQRALYNPSSDKQGVLANTANRFKQAFPALVDAYNKGIPTAVTSPYDYQRTVAEYQRVMAQYGLGSLTSDQISKMITNHVTPDDLNKRAQMAVESYSRAPQQVKDALANQYGITPEMAQRHILDPSTSIEQIQHELSGSSLIAAGARAGITKNDASQLVSLSESPTSGVSQQDISNAVQKANELSYLQQPTVGKDASTQTTVSAPDVLGATVQGFSPDQIAQQEKINKAIQERQQASMAGGQILADQSGVKGAGQIQ